MKVYIGNAFSMSMLPTDCTLACRLVDSAFVNKAIDYGAISVIGHDDLVPLLWTEYGLLTSFNRVSTKLEFGDLFIVCQYDGPRLELGVVSLPKGAQIVFWAVNVRYLGDDFAQEPIEGDYIPEQEYPQ